MPPQDPLWRPSTYPDSHHSCRPHSPLSGLRRGYVELVHIEAILLIAHPLLLVSFSFVFLFLLFEHSYLFEQHLQVLVFVVALPFVLEHPVQQLIRVLLGWIGGSLLLFLVLLDLHYQAVFHLDALFRSLLLFLLHTRLLFGPILGSRPVDQRMIELPILPVPLLLEPLIIAIDPAVLALHEPPPPLQLQLPLLLLFGYDALIPQLLLQLALALFLQRRGDALRGHSKCTCSCDYRCWLSFLAFYSLVRF
jgi:hypothetical protein